MAHRQNNPDDIFMYHVGSVLEMMQKVSDKAGKLATHTPKDHPWIRSYLQEISNKIDDLGERFEEELEENNLI